jgi:ATP-dependent RNA helicase DOB1
MRQRQDRETAWKSVLEVQRRFPDGIALLDPIRNMGIKDDKFKALVKVCSSLFDEKPSNAVVFRESKL